MDAKDTTRLVEQVDHHITTQINDKRDSWQIRLLGTASEVGDQPQMRALCGATIALGIIRRDKRLAKTGFRMLAAHTLATWGKSRVKAVINRRRPESGDDPRIRPGDSDAHEDNSFPSGHSAGAVAVGQAFTRSYPDHALAARGAAALISGVQVPRGTHYAGDVVAGMLIGLVAERASDATIELSLRWLAANTSNVVGKGT